MRRFRRQYYDLFSRFYDGFIALHSRDPEGMARKFLVERVPVHDGGSVLDLCSGTGTLLAPLRAKVGSTGRVVAVDFSPGMLRVAHGKTRTLDNVHLLVGDAAELPFAPGTFDAVTCSHAFYELKGETQERALSEIVRILRPGGTFLMMEHDVPKHPVVRALFYLRLTIAGAGKAITFLRQERAVLDSRFGSVEKIAAPAGRSKVLVCRT